MRTPLLLATLALGLVPLGRADAYPSMVRHGYTSCASCHADPSGSMLLTRYGRAQHELLLAATFGEEKSAEDEAVERRANRFFFGLVPLPPWLDLNVSYRGGYLTSRTLNEGPDLTDTRRVPMVADVRARLSYGPFRLAGTLGFLPDGAGRLAALTDNEENNLIAREYWAGWVESEEQVLLVRAGRMNLPFGLRNVEHTTWVRDETRTNINDHQQHGASVAYNVEGLRAELMGIAGNFQLRPDDFRERGYSGLVEWAPLRTAAVGLSSLVTFADLDRDTSRADLVRQVHGLFARYSPAEPLALLAEGDFLVDSSSGVGAALGFTGFLQADYELFQGLHLLGTGELLRRPRVGDPSYGGWLSAAFIPLPQVELRVDTILRRVSSGAGYVNQLALFGQLHLSL